jgi:hypothetical protein
VTFSCDHDASRQSLQAFRATTKRHQLQDDGEGGTLLLGNCTGCGTTLAVPIEFPRGHVVASGEIETYRNGLRIDPPKDDGDPPF